MSVWMRPSRTSTILGTVFVLAASQPMRAAEKPVKLEALPPAVRKAVLAQTQGATIVGITQEKEAGQTVYEVETKLGGRTRDINFAADGSLIDVEEEIEAASLPAAVKASLDKAVAGGKVLKMESITRDGKLQAYEAQVEIGGKKSEIKLGPDGQLVK